MNPLEQFDAEKSENIKAQGRDSSLKDLGLSFLVQTAPRKYSYNFTWMGRPIIAFPQDMIAMQELIWEIKPDLIVETGVAHGGSIVYYASLLELVGNDGLVVGIDIDIRPHNRDLIESHPMFKRIRLIEGSSISQEVVQQVKSIAEGRKKVMICLDSNHTHDHVLDELRAYAPLTSVGSYCVVFDTVVEDMPADWKWDRPWGRGDNPKTAVYAFLQENSDFVIDRNVDSKLIISVAPEGYLKRIK
ncbi:MAG TPA: cephalosporin hydroxylase family protein [Puia sp.]|jgi:cephalosporin hydroxylase|nr:cephalosporin hydroxylase family protein [Puia sp.]